MTLLCAEPTTAKSSKTFRRSLLAEFNDTSAPDIDIMDMGQLSSQVTTSDREEVVSEQLPSLSQKSSSPPMSPGGACATVDIGSGKSPASLLEAAGRWLTGTE